MTVNACPTCAGPLELVHFAGGTRTAVWCGSCNLMWAPMEAHTAPDEPNEADPLTVVHARELKAQIERRVAKQAEDAKNRRRRSA